MTGEKLMKQLQMVRENTLNAIQQVTEENADIVPKGYTTRLDGISGIF